MVYLHTIFPQSNFNYSHCNNHKWPHIKVFAFLLFSKSIFNFLHHCELICWFILCWHKNLIQSGFHLTSNSSRQMICRWFSSQELGKWIMCRIIMFQIQMFQFFVQRFYSYLICDSIKIQYIDVWCENRIDYPLKRLHKCADEDFTFDSILISIDL